MELPSFPPPRRVIEGGVEARASNAEVALNRSTEAIATDTPLSAVPPPPAASVSRFFFREILHFRVTVVGEGPAQQQLQVQMFERVPEGGTWPENLARFQGLGRINAQHPAIGNIEKNYRFDVPGLSLDAAWEAFEAASVEGSQLAKQQLRVEIAQMMRQQADALAVPQPGQADAILSKPVLGPNGRPLGH